KLLFQSVRGPAHARAGQPCQDHCLVRLRRTRHGTVLILACADGSGSSPLADVGARLACRVVVGLVVEALERIPPAVIDRPVLMDWLHRLRCTLAGEGQRRGASAHDLATTLLLAIVAEDAAVFAQVGDGVIVVGDADGY